MFHLLCYYLLEAYSFSNERQKRSGSGREGRGGKEEQERVEEGKTVIRLHYLIFRKYIFNK